ncbi:MAG: ABC-2 family transporter protein [Bacilli bacterium]|nr:ABC-2 family transporter protein [Bacilli bacterium]
MRLFFKYLALHLKIELEYKSSFIMTILAQVFYILAELITIIAVIAKFELFDMYSIYEVLFNFSVLWFGYACMEFIFRGFDLFSQLIVSGDFDILLIRPRSLFIQIVGSKIGYEKIGRLIVITGLFIYTIAHLITNWTILKALLLLFVLIGVCAMYLAIFIFGAALSFVTIQGLEAINIFSSGSRQVGQYPMQIYHKAVIWVFTFVIPLTVVNYYPLDYLLDRTTNIAYVFMPLLTFILFILSLIAFRFGVKKYTSTGS